MSNASHDSPAPKTPSRWIAILSGVGLVVSWIQTVHFFQNRQAEGGFKSFCTFGAFDCDKVEASRWADFIIPGIPISAFAAGFFLGFLILSFLIGTQQKRAQLIGPMRVLATLGSAFSLFLVGVMATQLGTWCLLCLIVDVCVLSIAAIAWTTRATSASSSQWKTPLQVMAFTALVAFVGAWLMKAPSEQPGVRAAILQGTLESAPTAVGTDASFPSIGPADAPITIVKFSDFQCPHCKKGALTVHQVMARFPGKIRFVLRNFPLDVGCNRLVQQPMHPAACEAARVVVCAAQAGKFEPVYEAIFEAQKDLVPGLPVQLGTQKGLDEAQLKTCVDAPSTISAVQRDVEEGISLGIQGTPTFYLNKKRVAGFPDLELWTSLIQAELKAKGIAH